MNINSVLAYAVLGHLQTICPRRPGELLEVATHLDTIQKNLVALQNMEGVHFAYPVVNDPHEGVSVVRVSEGFCYNVPCVLYTLNRDMFAEIPLPQGRFLPKQFHNFINPLPGELMRVYHENTGVK